MSVRPTLNFFIDLVMYRGYDREYTNLSPQYKGIMAHKWIFYGLTINEIITEKSIN